MKVGNEETRIEGTGALSNLSVECAPSVCLPEIVIPSADAQSVSFQNPSAHWSFCLRVSGAVAPSAADDPLRSEEHTSELQSLMRISYAVFCLTKKNDIH